MSEPESSPQHAERTLSRSAAALVFGTRGIQAAVTAGEELLTLDLRQLALSPAHLITVREEAEGVGVPSFPTLLDRLGEEDLVTLESRAERPHVHFGNLIAEPTRALQHGWGPFEALAVVVSAYATDLQRSLILKAAHRVGWQKVELVHKTTAVAVEALQQRESGNYLVLVLDHEAAEASVVEWQDRSLRAISYSIAPELSGNQLDRELLRDTLERLSNGGDEAPPFGLYTPRDWAWLQQRMQQVREQLDLRQRVRLEIPAALTTGATAEVAFERAELEERLTPIFTGIETLVRRCCAEAGGEWAQLRGLVVSGSLLRQASVLAHVRHICQGTRLTLCASDVRSRGACRRAAKGTGEERAPQKGGKAAMPWPAPEELRINAQFPEPFEHPIPTADQQPVGANSIIDRVRALVGSDRRSEAKQALAPLKEYIEALELSLEEPAVALEKTQAAASGAPAGRSRRAGQPSRAGSGDSAEPAAVKPSPEADQEAAEKTRKRKYVLAKDDLKKAEKALREGNLELAVRLSHRAFETSNAGRIFRAMIEVHLRAARRRPSTPETFGDDRRWLLCALSDDGTNDKVQEAIAERFLTHAEQLVERGTEKDHSVAISILHEMTQHLSPNELAQRWLQELKEAEPGSIKLTR